MAGRRQRWRRTQRELTSCTIQLSVQLCPHRVDVRRPCQRAGRDRRPPPNASVYIISPNDGDTVANPFKVQFGLSGMGVAPAGVDKPNTGHHHLLIDVNEPLDPNEPIPQDKVHLHFGAGQTESQIELPPGKHTLQLVLGDWSHIPFNPPIMSAVITVIVK
jgi:Domain of unknown function (DUF4399)